MRSEPPTGDELTRLLVSMKRNVLEQVAQEPAPKPKKRSTVADRVIGLTLAVALLFGLGAGAAFAFGFVPPLGGPSDSAPASTRQPSPESSPIPTPSHPPIEYTVSPEEPAPRYDLDAASAYELCVSAVGEGVRQSRGGSFDVAPLDQAEVVEREDGRFFVWAEFSDSTLSPELQELGAAHCVVGGSVDSPDWVTMGQVHRDYREQFNPNQPVEDFGE